MNYYVSLLDRRVKFNNLLARITTLSFTETFAKVSLFYLQQRASQTAISRSSVHTLVLDAVEKDSSRFVREFLTKVGHFLTYRYQQRSKINPYL